MEHKNEGSTEKILKSVGRKIDELINKAKQNSEGLDEKLDNGMDELRKSWQKIDKEFKDFTEENKDKFKDAGTEIEKAAQDLKKSVEAAFRKSQN